MTIPYSELSETVPDELLCPLDRVAEPSFKLNDRQQFYRDNGYLIVPNFSQHHLIDAYCERWLKDHKEWRHDTPYMDVEELCHLALPLSLMGELTALTHDEMGLNLCLVNWVSTERAWHQDDYLNPNYINNHYCAVWFALEDIHPDSGPFEFVPGSHKWPLLRRERVLSHFPPEMAKNPSWPALTESVVVPSIEAEIERTGLQRQFFMAKKGDILIWSGRLIHRGSYPKVRGMERRALICHYSSIEHRKDMPHTKVFHGQGKYFVL